MNHNFFLIQQLKQNTTITVELTVVIGAHLAWLVVTKKDHCNVYRYGGR